MILTIILNMSKFCTYLSDSNAEINIFNMSIFIKANLSDCSGLYPIPYLYLESEKVHIVGMKTGAQSVYISPAMENTISDDDTNVAGRHKYALANFASGGYLFSLVFHQSVQKKNSKKM